MKMEGLEIVTLPRSVVFSPKSCVSFDCQPGSYFRLFISSAMSELHIYLLNTARVTLSSGEEADNNVSFLPSPPPPPPYQND